MNSTHVNVLIYAFDEAARDHAQYRAWVEAHVNGNGAFRPGRTSLERLRPHQVTQAL